MLFVSRVSRSHESFETLAEWVGCDRLGNRKGPGLVPLRTRLIILDLLAIFAACFDEISSNKEFCDPCGKFRWLKARGRLIVPGNV